MLSVMPSMDRHPFGVLLARGVPCSINADDRLLFGTGLLTEYERARDGLGLTGAQLAQCAHTSLLYSAAPRDQVDKALEGIDAWLGQPLARVRPRP
jgi:adenosine deaminase